MGTTTWPAYAPRKRRTPWRAYWVALRRRDLWPHAGLPYLLAWAGYFAVLVVPLPWVGPPGEPAVAAAWPGLLVSDALTGGALERGTVGAAGLWAVAAATLARVFGPQGRAAQPLWMLLRWLLAAAGT